MAMVLNEMQANVISKMLATDMDYLHVCDKFNMQMTVTSKVPGEFMFSVMCDDALTTLRDLSANANEPVVRRFLSQWSPLVDALHRIATSHEIEINPLFASVLEPKAEKVEATPAVDTKFGIDLGDWE